MSRRLGLAAVLAAGVGLSLVWHASPSASPPVYDGVCLADPYRLLGGSPPPLSATKMYGPVSGGNFQVSQLTSNDDRSQGLENPAQAQVLLQDGTFVSPAAPFTLSLTPVQRPAIAPRGGRIDGNVYRIIAVTPTGQQLNPVDAQHGITVLLRGTASNPPRTMERFDANAWTDLRTFSAGCGDTFEAVSPRMGEFALVLPAQAANGSGGSVPLIPIVVAAIVICLGTSLVLLRFNRARAA